MVEDGQLSQFTNDPPEPLTPHGYGRSRSIARAAWCQRHAGSMGASFQCLPDSRVNRDAPCICYAPRKCFGFLR